MKQPRSAATSSLSTFRAAWVCRAIGESWRTQRKRQIFGRLTDWSFEVNIYEVPDLEAFLQAALLLPRSLTSDFNFPSWHYFGRGSGEQGDYHRYQQLGTERESRLVEVE